LAFGKIQTLEPSVTLSSTQLRSAAATLDKLDETLGKLDVNVTGTIEVHTGTPTDVIGFAVPQEDGSFLFRSV